MKDQILKFRPVFLDIFPEVTTPRSCKDSSNRIDIFVVLKIACKLNDSFSNEKKVQSNFSHLCCQTCLLTSIFFPHNHLFDSSGKSSKICLFTSIFASNFNPEPEKSPLFTMLDGWYCRSINEQAQQAQQQQQMQQADPQPHSSSSHQAAVAVRNSNNNVNANNNSSDGEDMGGPDGGDSTEQSDPDSDEDVMPTRRNIDYKAQYNELKKKLKYLLYVSCFFGFCCGGGMASIKVGFLF